MTILSPVSTYDPAAAPPAGRPSRWRRSLSRRGKVATAGAVTAALVAGVLGASYQTAPGGTLWGVEKAVFPAHAQEVALTAVAADLKRAQDILGSGQQPTADQLSDARDALNQAKQHLDYLSDSSEQAGMQNLYLQLTQQLLEYTPASAQQLPSLPVLPPEPAAGPTLGDPAVVPDATLMSSIAPSWGYSDAGPGGDVATISQQSGTYDYGPPPPGIPPVADPGWQQPYAPPITPNLQNLGYYDPSWGRLYGYNPGSWYNYNLGGYNQYGYDFLGFNRWGYDRWGYDRWGYDQYGYNWGGYNWAGYDRGGWDRDGRNEWGQRRGWPGDPRNQGWYNGHHAYQAYYGWKFQHDDPVFGRTQWDKARGFNRDRYQDWNKNRDWHDSRNRDWAPVQAGHSDGHSRGHASAPVVNLNASLTQFISNDKSHHSDTLLQDLKGKSPRDFSKGIVAHHEPPTKAPVGSHPGNSPQQPGDGSHPGTSPAGHQTQHAPPALTDHAPKAPRSKVAPGFTAPKLAPVPVVKPSVPAALRGDTPKDKMPFGDVPKDKFGDVSQDKGPKDVGKTDDGGPRSESKPSVGQKDSAPGADRPVAPKPDQPAMPPRDVSGPQGNSAPRGTDSDAKATESRPQPDKKPQQDRPDRQAPQQSQAPQRPVPQESKAPEPPASQHQEEPEKQVPQKQQRAPEPKHQAPAPERQAPAPESNAPAPVQQAPAHEAPAPKPQAPTLRPQPPVHEVPAPKAPSQHHDAPRQAPALKQEPPQRSDSKGGGSKCSGPFCQR